MANGNGGGLSPLLKTILNVVVGLAISAGTAFVVATRQQAVDHAALGEATAQLGLLRDKVQTIEIEQAGQKATMTQLVNDMGEVKRDVKELLRILIARR